MSEPHIQEVESFLTNGVYVVYELSRLLDKNIEFKVFIHRTSDNKLIKIIIEPKGEVKK